VATDGVVIAADSQMTDMDAHIRASTAEKLCCLGTHIVWGLSGPVGIAQQVRPALEIAYRAAWAQKAFPDLRDPIAQSIAATRKKIHQHQVVGDEPGVALLFAGMTGAANAMTPWLMEVPNNNVVQQHHIFCAVGSGAKAGYHAFESLRHYEPSQRGVALAKLFLYRIMDDATRAEFFGVGGAIHVWTITAGGFQKEPDAEMQGLAQMLTYWREAERDSLKNLIAPTAASPREFRLIAPTPDPIPPASRA